ncbi:nucleoid-associated protein [Hymenobacter sp. YC55]|uniref:nucleoid-associated protein n=1 Tax=Hymenobacter sp. YC55 TaxID=3034019 RepID=UPI0023F8E084|nr:nucleoid-associated protein [Hymenobacter sp. YC55]MDF7815375.1 nucleoid-associated protein [Hymenobacter sp. YC55]
MNLLFSSLYKVGHEANEPQIVTAHHDRPEAAQYINELVQLVLTNANRRSYHFQGETVEVCSALAQYHNGSGDLCYQQAARIIAARLHRTELRAREDSSNLVHEIPVGILIQAFIEDAVSRRLLIVKSDHDQFLDDESFMTRAGLPKKKKVFKAFLAELSLDGEILDLYVCDSSGSHSKYWWRGFLELQEKRDDAHNTKTFWDALDREVLMPLKKKHRVDHEIIRNAMILYVKSNDHFELSDFIQTTVGKYEPEDDSLSVTNLTQALRDLPTKRANKLFDTSFGIVKKEIKARFKRTYAVTEDIDLVIKSGLEDFKGEIQAIEEEGIKYLKIRTNQDIYNTFSKPE